MATRGFGRAEDVKLPVEVRLARLGHVEPRAVAWLWPGRVPLGKVTLLMGDPGQGKSLVALDLAARVTRGLGWPDATGLPIADLRLPIGGDGGAERASESAQRAEERASALPAPQSAIGNPKSEIPERSSPGSVVLLSAEDDAADTIRPRLEAAGGDADRVIILRSIRRPGSGRDENLPFTLGLDLAALEAAIKNCGDARLVILDPVSAYLSGVDANSNAGLREVLAPLRDMAERTGVAVVAISHLTKRAEASVMYRALGSLAFVAAARAVWAVGPDRQAAGRLLFLPVKCNLAGGVTGLAYRIVPSAGSKEVPVIAWESGPVAMTAAEALGPASRRAPTRWEQTGMWLRGLLASGPVACELVDERARAAGISPTSLRRAKSEMGAVAYRDGFETPWMLCLAQDVHRPEQSAVAEQEPVISWSDGADGG